MHGNSLKVGYLLVLVVLLPKEVLLLLQMRETLLEAAGPFGTRHWMGPEIAFGDEAWDVKLQGCVESKESSS